MPEIGREFFVSGGTLPQDSASYIERSADRELFENLSAGRYCYVLNSRQMGKSSLSVRTVAKINERGIQTAFIDLTQIGQNVQAEQWYAGLTGEVGRAFGITSKVLKYFMSKSELSPMQRFFGAIRDVVLEDIKDPIVIFIDEIDSTRNLKFDTYEFYAGIRECFNRRVVDEMCKRLTFCLIGVAVPNDLIRNPLMTPFNIGEKIRLQDFELDEVRRFSAALGPNGDRLARRVHYWTNGQPFLTQSLCREIAADTRIQEERDVDALVQKLYFGPKALETNINLADVANRVLWDSEQSASPDKYRANLLSAYERTWRGGSIPDDEANRIAVVLKLSGLLSAQGARLVTRNRIYHHVFNRAWIEANMPNQELMRQVQSFRRGLARGIGLAALIGAVIGGLALFAFQARREAVMAKTQLEYELYVSQMNSLGLLEGSGDEAGMAAVLDSSRNNPNRGFEWDFWMGHLHDGIEEYTMDYSIPGKDERGFLSQDGKQIYVRDSMTNTGAVVDRKTKRVVTTTNIDLRKVIATSAGFLVIHSVGLDNLGIHDNLNNDNPQPVTELMSGRVVCKIGTPGYLLVAQVSARDQTDFVVMEEQKKGDRLNRIFSAWDITNGRCLYRTPREKVISADPDSIRTPISKDARRFCFRLMTPLPQPSKSYAEYLVVWDGKSNRELDRIPFPGEGKVIEMSPTGKLLAYQSDQRLWVRDLDQKKEIYSQDTDVDPPTSVAFSTDDQAIACTTSNGVTKIREIPSGHILAVKYNLRNLQPSGQDSLWVGCSSSVRLLKIIPERRGERQTVAVDGKGSIRIATRRDPKLDRFSDPDLKPLPSIQLPPGAKSLTYNRLWCLTQGPDGHSRLTSTDGSSESVKTPVDARNLACGISSRLFVVLAGSTWTAISGSTGAVLWQTTKSQEYSGMWITPDSSHLIATTASGYVALLDIKSGRELRRIRVTRTYIGSVTISRDGKQFLTGGGEGLAVLWDTDTFKKLQEFHGIPGQALWGGAISPDGRRVATCSNSGEWEIWDSKTGVKLTKIRDSILPLRSVTFTSDGKSLLAAGDDSVLRIYPGLDQDPTMKIPISDKTLKYLNSQ